MPRRGSAARICAFSAAVSSSVRNTFVCVAATARTIATSGRTSRAFRRIDPSSAVPISITAKRCQGRMRRIVRGTPVESFRLCSVFSVEARADRMAARHSLVVVLPTLPVIAMTVVRSISRRHSQAQARSARSRRRLTAPPPAHA